MPPTTVTTPEGVTVVVSRTVTEVELPLVTFETTTTVFLARRRAAC